MRGASSLVTSGRFGTTTWPRVIALLTIALIGGVITTVLAEPWRFFDDHPIRSSGSVSSVLVVYVLGITITALVTALVSMLLSSRRRALALADGTLRELRSLSEAVSQGIATMDENCNVRSWNHGAEAIFGYDAQEMVGASVLQIIPEADRDAAREWIASVFRGEIEVGAEPYEIVGHRKDGTAFPVEVSIATWDSDDGSRLASMFRDIGDRKQVEDDLHLTTKRLESILDHATETAIVATDGHGLITVWNRGAARLLGYSADEMIGRRIPKLVGTSFDEQREDATAPPLGDAIADTREWTFTHKDGRPVTVLLTITAIDGAHEDETSYIGIATDLSALRAAERDLAVANEGFRLAFDNAPTGIIVSDLDGRVVQANATLGRIFRSQASHLEDANIKDFDVDGPPPETEQKVAALINGDMPVLHLTRELKRKDGTVLWVATHTSVTRDEDGRPLTLVSHIEDISERHYTDLALQEALHRQNEMLDRLTDLDRMKSDFVAAVSHDLRTPLTSIVGYAEVLVEGDLGELSEDQLRVLEVMQHGAGQLQRRIDDLLTFSRIEAGTYETAHVRAAFDVAVRDALLSLAGQAQHKGVELVVDMEPNIAVLGDTNQLEQLVLNLVGNAIKFTSGGGHVDIVVRREDADAVLIVRDTGIGIPVQDQSKVFERFFRSGEARDLHIPGTGLGLAIVKSIVDGHHGRVAVDSSWGSGTTFTVALPALDGEPEPEFTLAPEEISWQPSSSLTTMPTSAN